MCIFLYLAEIPKWLIRNECCEIDLCCTVTICKYNFTLGFTGVVWCTSLDIRALLGEVESRDENEEELLNVLILPVAKISLFIIKELSN